MSFFDTIHCQSRQHCEQCRSLNGGRKWRETVLRIFKTNVPVDFECPIGLQWNVSKKEVESVHSIVTATPPRKTIKQAKSFARALLTGKYVSEKILKERVEICGKCKFLKVSPDGTEWCGICGCKTSTEYKKIRNLVAYEENLPEWGCKHPGRPSNGGWKR